MRLQALNGLSCTNGRRSVLYKNRDDLGVAAQTKIPTTDRQCFLLCCVCAGVVTKSAIAPSGPSIMRTSDNHGMPASWINVLQERLIAFYRHKGVWKCVLIDSTGFTQFWASVPAKCALGLLNFWKVCDDPFGSTSLTHLLWHIVETQWTVLADNFARIIQGHQLQAVLKASGIAKTKGLSLDLRRKK